jgi:hypothetical protein
MESVFSVDTTLDDMTSRTSGQSGDSRGFETSDFYLACYLRCIGYTLDDLRRSGPRAIFVFCDQPARRADLMAFFGNKAEVKPLQFVSAIKDLKALIHNS